MLAAMDTAHAQPDDDPPGAEQCYDAVQAVVWPVVLHEHNHSLGHGYHCV